MKYLISYPDAFREDNRYPLILFLHGAGSRGDSTEKLKRNSSIQNLLKRQNERGYVLIAPLCQRGNWYEWMPVLLRLLEAYRNCAYIDSKRIHVTGKSMGGYGTWALATLRPNWFASVMPICGGGITEANQFGRSGYADLRRRHCGLCYEPC